MFQPPDRSKAPILNTAPVIRWLLGICIVIHFVMVALPDAAVFQIVERFAFISARYTVAGAWQFDPVAFIAGPLTHAFLHVSFTHLMLNMAILLAFGTAVARRMQAGYFLLLYGICAIAGAFFWSLIHPDSFDPLLGASGAISGMVGAVGGLSLARPRGHGLPFPNRGAALIFVAVWLVINFIFGIFGGAIFGVAGAIAWEAHLGGFVAGFALIRLFARSAPPPPYV